MTTQQKSNRQTIDRPNTVLILTGPAAMVQGFGGANTTAFVKDALAASGKQVVIADVKDESTLATALASPPDIVWSSLYTVGGKAEQIRSAESVTDVHLYLEQAGILHVGSPSAVLSLLLDKAETNRRLKERGIPVPHQIVASPGSDIVNEHWPALVKPRWESESRGISEANVVETPDGLYRAVESIWSQFEQDALIEEYLPGREYTALVIGRSPHLQAYGALNVVARDAYDTYPLIAPWLKEGGVQLHKLTDERAEVGTLAMQAATALGCRDHVRIDMRRDKDGALKIMEVNGIPGLKPGRSRSLAIYAMYHPDLDNGQSQQAFINAIVDGALNSAHLQKQPDSLLEQQS